MAKFVSDSLMPSKANAPLDKRTEIDTLADYVNIENPNESLVFYCKDTKKRYEVVSLKEEVIEGTSITRKVIGEYKEFGGLTDEQKQDIEDTKEGLEKVTSDIEDTKLELEEVKKESVTYDEIGEVDLDDVIDQPNVTMTLTGETEDVDFEGLQ